MQRKYSVDEIDRMRQALATLWIHERMIWDYSPDGRCIGGQTSPYSEDEQRKDVEDQLRTYMFAGVEPEDLEKKAAQSRPS